MSEVTLKVPAEHFEAFRLAALKEVGNTAEWIGDMQDDVTLRVGRDGATDAGALDDLHASARHLAKDLAVVDQMFPRPAATSGAIEVHGEPDTLAHIAMTMADKVIAPRIATETNTTPYDEEAVAAIGALSTALGWAAGESARLEAEANAERRTAKAGALDG